MSTFGKPFIRFKWAAAFAFALLISFGACVGAGSAAPATTRVLLDAGEVKFNVEPLNEAGTVYVEFKPLFQALGFIVSYDAGTKTVTGVSKDVTIRMQLGTANTLINGNPPKTPVRAIVSGGHSLVPLRFIGEAAGLLVNWDAAAHTVKLAHKPAEALKASVEGFFRQMADALDKRDPDAYLALLDPSNQDEMTKAAVHYYLPQSAKVKNEFSDIKIVKSTNSSVTAAYTQTIKKDGDDFYIDRQVTGQYVLNRSANGGWLIAGKSTSSQKLLNADELLKQDAAVPDADKQAVLDVIDSMAKAINDKDLTAAASLLDQNSPYFKPIKESLTNQLQGYDLKITIEKESVVSYTDSMAYVYFVQKTERMSGPAFENSRIAAVSRLIKDANGKWVKDPTNDVISYEKL